MLLIIALILFVAWIVGFGFFRAVAGGAIHIILVLAVIALVWHFVSAHSGTTTTSMGGLPTRQSNHGPRQG